MRHCSRSDSSQRVRQTGRQTDPFHTEEPKWLQVQSGHGIRLEDDSSVTRTDKRRAGREQQQ